MYLNFCVRSLLCLVVTSAFQEMKGQSLSTSIKNEMKKDLLKQVNPSMATPNSSMKQSPNTVNNTMNSDNLLEFSKKYRKGSGGEEFDSRYKVNPHAVTYSSKVPINQIEPGKVIPIYNGGHFIFVNPATNAKGLVTPSGLDLSGGGKKKMSNRTRLILEQVFGVVLEDKNQ